MPRVELSACIIAVGLALLPSQATAQGRNHDCAAIAERVRAPGHAAAAARLRDLDDLGTCPRATHLVAATALANGRSAHDTLYLIRLVGFAMQSQGKAALPLLLDIAADRSASVEARVTAMLGVMEMENPNQPGRFQDVVGGFDESRLLPVHGCRRTMIAGRVPAYDLTKEDLARIRATVRRIRADSTLPLDVRTAAACSGEVDVGQRTRLKWWWPTRWYPVPDFGAPLFIRKEGFFASSARTHHGHAIRCRFRRQ